MPSLTVTVHLSEQTQDQLIRRMAETNYDVDTALESLIDAGSDEWLRLDLSITPQAVNAAWDRLRDSQ